MGKCDYVYKTEQLKTMRACETGKHGEDNAGYGATLDHWSGKAKPIKLDAEALQVLINHYETKKLEG